jgi:hypothetical protein
LPEERVTVQTFTITEADSGQTRVYHNTTKAWSDDELIELLAEAGFVEAARRDEWPCNTEDLRLWVARRS